MLNMNKALACTCGDCVHWEILGDAVNDGVMSANVVLRCMTCKHEFKATMQVDAHEKLTEVDVPA